MTDTNAPLTDQERAALTPVVRAYQEALPEFVQQARDAGALEDCVAAADQLVPAILGGGDKMAATAAVALIRLAQLEERLTVAERVCSLFGATASRMDTDRDKALHELWRVWIDRYGAGVERISDAEVAELARQRDEIRARTLAKIRGGEAS